MLTCLTLRHNSSCSGLYVISVMSVILVVTENLIDEANVSSFIGADLQIKQKYPHSYDR